MASSSCKIRILKTWVSQDLCFIFQCQPSSPETDFPKKVHLTLDLRQQSFGARFTAEKPADASSNHAFIQILRKQLPHFTIKEILLDPSTGNLWIPLLAGAETAGPWRLLLARSRPPLASLIDPKGTIFVSYGQKGTFTKKHQLETPIPEQLEKNILPALLEEIVLNRSAPSGEETHADDDKEANGGASDTELLPQAQRELSSRLKRKQKTIRKTLEKLKKDLPIAGAVEAEEQRAQLLQSYSYLLKPEAIKLHLESALTGLEKDVLISLDPELSKGAQIEAAFHAARRLRRARTMGLQQIEQAEAQLRSLEDDISFLRDEIRTPREWEVLIRKYRLPELTSPSSKTEEGGAKPYKTYFSSSGRPIYVGKDARNNDILTKAARSNDYWLHAVNGTGSHIVIPSAPDIRQALPTSLLREAAILALHFSRFRDDFAGECYVTRKAHIKKPKGMAPGLWRIDQSETLFFRYSETELKSVLSTLKL